MTRHIICFNAHAHVLIIMESVVKRTKTTDDIRSDLLNRIVPLGGGGVPAFVAILRNLDVIDAYSVCGPERKLHDYCERHSVWKAYAEATLGLVVLRHEEQTLLPIVNLIGGKINYLWLLLVRHAVSILFRPRRKQKSVVYFYPHLEILIDYRLFDDNQHRIDTGVLRVESSPFRSGAFSRELIVRCAQAALLTTPARNLYVERESFRVPLHAEREALATHVIYAMMALPPTRMVVSNSAMETPTFPFPDNDGPDDDDEFLLYSRSAEIRDAMKIIKN